MSIRGWAVGRLTSTWIALALLATGPMPAGAATKTWNAGVNYTWDTGTTANWSGSTWTAADMAVFGATGTGTVTVAGGGVTATRITFDAPGYTLTGGAITLNAGSDPLIAANADAVIGDNITLSGAQTWNVNAGRTLTLNGTVNAAAAGTAFGLGSYGTYVFNGSIGSNVGNVLFNTSNGNVSKATFAAANTFTGQLFLGSGGGDNTLSFSDVNQLGSGAGANYIAIQYASTLRYTGSGSQSTASRDLYWNSGAAAIDIPQATANLTFVISGGTRNQAFTKSGAGTLTLSGSGSSGTLTVAGGAFRLLNAPSGSHTSSTELLNGTALEFSNTVVGFASRKNSNAPLFGTGTMNITGGGWSCVYGVVSLSGQINVTGNSVFANDNLTANWAGSIAGLNVTSGSEFHSRGQNTTLGALTGVGHVGNDNTSATAILTVGAGNGSGTYDGVIHGNNSSAVDGNIDCGLLALTKAGTGTQTLTGASTYTGTTTVNGGDLLLDAATGSLSASSPLTLGGGNFVLKGKTGAFSSAQTLGALTLTAGTASRITINPNNGTSTTLTLGNAWTRNAGSSLLVDCSSANTGTRQLVTAGATTGYVLSNGLYGSIFVKDGAGDIGFATRAAGASQPLARYSDETLGTALADNSNDATANFTTRNTAYTAGVLAWSNGITTRSANSLTLDTSNSGGTIDLGASANILTLTSGGILFKGANNITLQGGQVGAAASEVLVNQTSAGTLTLTSLISGGAGSLTKAGDGTLVVNGTNTYTGGTVLQGGTLSVNSLADSGTSAIGNSGTLTLNSGTLKFTASGTSATSARTLNVTGTATIDVALGASLSFTGSATGGGYLTKAGAGSLTLNASVSADRLRIGATASDVGCLTVNDGVLSVTKTYVVFGEGGGAPATLTINGGSMSHTGGGGTWLDNGTGAASTLTVNGGSYTESAQLEQGQTVGQPSTVNLNGGALTFSAGTAHIGNAGSAIWNQTGGNAVFGADVYLAYGAKPATMTLSGGTFTSGGAGWFNLGFGNGLATLNISSNAYFSSPWFLIGRDNYYSRGIVNLSGGTMAIGSGSPRIYLGHVGNATWNQTAGTATFAGEVAVNWSAGRLADLTIGGGTFSVPNGVWTYIGYGANTYTTMAITNTGSVYLANMRAAYGSASRADIAMTGGTLTVGSGNLAYLGMGASAHCYWSQTGGTATFQNQLNIADGSAGVSVLNISGGTLQETAGDTYLGVNGNATLNLSGTGYVTLQGGIHLGYSNGTLGAVNLSGGTLSANGYCAFGSYQGTTSGSGLWNQTGGTATFGQNINLANGSGASSVTVSGGTFALSSGIFYLGVNGAGTLTVTNTASVTLQRLNFGYNAAASGVLNLGGGTLRIGANGITQGGGTGGSGTINFNGGTLQTAATMSVPATSMTTVVKSGGALIDTLGNNFTIPTALTDGGGGGGLTKRGAGTLTLSGLSTYTGATTLNGGTVLLDLTNNTTGVLNGSSTLTLSGGNLTVQGKNTGTSSQTLGNLTVSGQGGVLTVNKNGGTSTTLTLGDTWTRTGSATLYLDVSGAGVNYVVANPAASLVGNIIPWVTIKDATGFGYATVSGGQVVRYGSTVNPLPASGANPAIDYTLIGSLPADASQTVTASETANTLSIGPAASGLSLTINSGLTLGFTQGTLAFDGTSNAYTISGPGQLGASNAALTLNTVGANALTIAAPVSDGTGSLVLGGNGVTILSGANTFSGGVTLGSGTLKLGSTTALGTGTLTINAGGLDSTVANLLNAGNNPQVWNGDFVFTGTQNLDLGTGLVSLGTAAGTVRSITVSANTLTIGGAIANGSTATGITKNGTGNLVFRGGSANTFTGYLTVNQGAVYFSKTGGSAAIGGDLVFDNNLSPDVYTTVDNQFPAGSVVRFINNTGDHGRLDLMGTSQTVAGLDNSSYWNERGVVQNSEAIANSGSSRLTLNGTGSYQFYGFLRNQTGTLGLSKTGSGRQTLVGGNIVYTGSTLLSAGVLSLYNATAYNSPTTISGGALENDARSGNVGWGSGATLTLSGGTFVHRGGGYLTLAGAVTLASNATISVVNSGSNNQLFLDNGLYGANRTLTINNVGTTTSGVHFRNTPGAFSGALLVNGGDIALNAASANTFMAADVSLNAADIRTDNSAFSMGGVANASLKSLSGSGNVYMGGSTLTLGANDGTGNFAGVIQGTSGNLIKLGAGTQTLSGASTYTGTTTLSAGTLKVSNTSGSATGSGAMTVSGGTLTGAGTISGTVSNTGGCVAPGASVGAITVGGLTMAAGSTYNFEFNATANDRIVVTGVNGLTINGGGFNLYQEGTATAWTGTGTFNLIQYNGALGGAGIGTLTVLNAQQGLNYTFGTSGGWITLTITSGAPVWNGNGADANWQTDANWNTGVKPSASNMLTFGTTGAQRVSNTNDFAANTRFGGITFNNDGVFTLRGSAVNLLGSVANNTANGQTISLPLVLDGAGRYISANAGNLTLNGDISEAGGAQSLTKSGSCTLTLGGTNTYTGGTVLSAGTLTLGSSQPIGTSGTLTFGGGTLQFSAANTTDYSSRFSGAAGQAYRLDTAGQSVTAAANLTSSGGTLAKLGTGTLTLTGTGNTYGGATTIDNGTLRLLNGATLPSPTTVNTNGTLLVDNNNATWQFTGSPAISLNGGTLSYYSAGNFWVVLATGPVTSQPGTSSTVTLQAGGSGNSGLFFDAGLKGSGTVTVNNATAGAGLNLRNNSTAFSGTLIVNGIASTTAGAGSGIGVGGCTTGLQYSDITLNGTMELLAQGIGWANTASGSFAMGALSGTGVMVANHTSAGVTTVTTGNTGNNGTFTGTIANGAGDTLNIVKVGSATQTIGGYDNHTGGTTLNGGTWKAQAPAVVSPTNIPGLAVWLDANDVNGTGINPADGTQLSTWVNKAPGGVGNFTGASALPYLNWTANRMNGNSAVHFWGGLLVNSVDFGNNVTVLYVGRMSGGANYRLLSANNNWLLGYWGNNMFVSHWANTPSDLTGTLDYGQHIFMGTANGTTAWAYDVDGGEVQTLTGALGAGPNGMALGGWNNFGTPSEQSYADIGELLVFTNYLSSAQRLQAEQYLQAKWMGPMASRSAMNLAAASSTLDLNGVNQTIGSLAGVDGSQVALGGAWLTIGQDGTSTTFSGVIGGSGSVTKTRGGILTLAGSSPNTYSGTTVINGDGRLALSKTAGVAAVPGNLLLINSASPILYMLTDNQLGGSGTLTMEGEAGNARVEIGNTVQTVAGIVSTNTARNGVIQHQEYSTANASGTGTLTLGGSGNYSYSAFVRDWNGVLAISKSGSGTQTLSGDRIVYTGTTALSGGTMVLKAVSGFNAPVALSGTAQLILDGSGGGHNNMQKVISGAGSGPVRVTGAGSWTYLLADNTYTCDTLIDGTGQLCIGNGTVPGSVLGSISNNYYLGISKASGSAAFTNAVSGSGHLNTYGSSILSSPSIVLGGDLTAYLGTFTNTTASFGGTFRFGNGGGTGPTIDSGASITVAGNLLTVPNSYNYQGLTIRGGSLAVAGYIDDEWDTGYTIVQTGGTVRVNGMYSSIEGYQGGVGRNDSYSLNAGTLIVGSAGINQSYYGMYAYLGGGTLSASTNWTLNANTQLTGTGGNATVDPAGYSLTFGWTVSGAGGLTVAGTNGGSVVMSTANTYTGPTTVSGATLLLNAAHTGGSAYTVTGGSLTLGSAGRIFAPSLTVTNTGSVGGTGLIAAPAAVQAGGTLTGTLTVSNLVTVQSGGILDPGTSGYGTLTVSNLVLEADAIVRIGSASNGFVQVTNALTTPVGTSAVIRVVSVPGVGQYPLIKHAGTFNGGGIAGLRLQAPRGVTATLVDNVGAKSVDINVTVYAPAVDYFTGASSAAWDVETSTNWLYSASPSLYYEGDFVIFDDTPGSNYTSTLAGTVLPGKITFSNATYAATLSGGGAIAGAAQLWKYGAATATLLSTNSYGGGTVLNGGTLSFLNGSLGTGSITFTNSATLNWRPGNTQDISSKLNAIAGGATATLDVGSNSVTFTTGVTGAGGVIKAGAGTLTMNYTGAASIYGGGTIVTNGTLRLYGGNNGYSTVGTGTVVIASAATVVCGSDNVFGHTTAANVPAVVIDGGTLNASVPYSGGMWMRSLQMTGGTVNGANGLDLRFSPTITVLGTAGGSTISCKLNFTTTATFDVADGAAASDLTLSGSAHDGALIKANSGLLLLSGPDNNGSLTATVNGGTLVLGKATVLNTICALGGPSTVLTLNNGGTARLSGTGGDQIYGTSEVSVNAGGIFDMNGLSESFDGLNGTGAGLITNTVPAVTSILTVGEQNASGVYAGAINGNIALTKLGSTAAQFLDGACTYSGPNTVLAGYLVARNGGALGSGGSSNVVASGGTLQMEGGVTISGEDATIVGNGPDGRGAFGGWSGNNIWNGTITLNGSAGMFAQANTTTLNGQIKGTGSLTKTAASNAGILTFGGALSNTYTGTTTVSAGRLYLSKTGGAIAVPGDITLNFSAGWGDYGLYLYGNEQIADTAVMRFTGSTWCGLFPMGCTETVAGLEASNYGVIENSYPVANAGTATLILNVPSGTNYNYGGNSHIRNGSSGGMITITKTGSGTQTFSAANITYSGTTVVSNGTLVLYNQTAYNSPTVINTNATLTWSGSADSQNNNAGATIALNSGGTLQNRNPANWTVINGAVTCSGITTINQNCNATGSATEGFFLDGGLKGTGTCTINAVNAGSGVNLRNNNSNFSGTLIVNGIAGAATFAGSGISVGGCTTGLQNSDITLNGTMELLNQGIGWANTASGTFKMGALSGTGIMIANYTSAGGTTVTLGNTGASGTFYGYIANGAGDTLQLVKIGAGTQTLCGTNTYTGATTISAGTLQLGDGSSGHDGSLTTSSATLSGGSTIAYNLAGSQAVSYSIIGTATPTLIKAGAGTLTLNNTGAVNFGSDATGRLFVNGGRLTFTGLANNTGLYQTGIVINAGATLEMNPGAGIQNAFGAWTCVYSGDGTFLKTGLGSVYMGYYGAGNRYMNLTSNALIDVSAGGLYGGANVIWTNNFASVTVSNAAIFDPYGNSAQINALSGAGTVQNNTGTSTLTLGVANGTGVFTGVIQDGAGSLAIVKTGTGTQTFSGANTYGGGTTLTNGTLVLGSTTAIGTGTLTIQGGAIDSCSAGLTNVNNNVQLWNADINFVGTQSLDLGTGGVTLNANRVVTVTSSVLGVRGAIGGGAVSLTKSGAGTLALGGANTYTGDTTVNAGTLAISGSSTLSDSGTLWIGPSGTVDVASGVYEVVRGLNLNGVTKWAGLWGSPASAADYKDAHFTGTGVVFVLTGSPNPATVFTFR